MPLLCKLDCLEQEVNKTQRHICLNTGTNAICLHPDYNVLIAVVISKITLVKKILNSYDTVDTAAQGIT